MLNDTLIMDWPINFLDHLPDVLFMQKAEDILDSTFLSMIN